MRVQKADIYYKQSLANKYLLNFNEISHLYEYNPYTESSFRQRLNKLADYSVSQRQRLSSVLKEYNLSIGCSKITLAQLEKLNYDAVVVLTGQQPGIFTGPLYTIYKALAACLLARKLESKLKVPVVPVFWVGSEDHDFKEINHVFLPGSEGPRRIEIPFGPQNNTPVGDIPLTKEIGAILQQLINSCPGEFQAKLSSTMQNIISGCSTLSQWFAAMMSWLFQDYGLIMADAMLPGLRKIQQSFFCRVINENDKIEQAFYKGYIDVASLGITPQVKYEPGKTNLFINYHSQRLALFRDGGQYVTRDGKYSWKQQELLAIAENTPQNFSLNVVLKPVSVEMMFPLLAYVAGPGEINYYGLYKHIYRHFSREMPVICPRPTATLVEPREEKYLNKYNLDAEEYIKHADACCHQYLENKQKININDVFAGFKEKIRNDYSTLGEHLSKVDDGMEALTKESMHIIMKKINWLQGKTEQRHRQKHQTAIRQLNWLRNRLLPHDVMQERVYNILPFIAKYGQNLICDIGCQPILDDIKHNIIYLEK
ncbi:MAG: bacillithiol biosynthesis cysteine-adding enzyme BshC [Firmicutes bacterium]|nr:bacillithiol biosynthesis cysteine-adding enzyme BshC [Bacillota bacterium]